MSITIYNTMSRSLEPFETIEPGKVRMYVCGVTPYSRSHIGHALSSIVFDVIKRHLTYRGYEVRHVTNFTDIDDKIINRSNAEGIDANELVESMIEQWHAEIDALGVLRADEYPRATLEIDSIIETIAGLIEDDHAYQVENDVYFRVRSFPGYGKLSHRSLDDLLSGARIQVDERKDDPLDFALWKGAKPGEPWWESPWGNGRPGWHIECSAMCSRHLDGIVDIHGGGADLIFPHHENEIAQSEAYLGREPFSRYWVHNGLLQLGGEKMSKSIGNLVSIGELIERDRTAAFRVYALQTHYRSPLTYTDEGLEAAQRGLERIQTAMDPGHVSTDQAPFESNQATAGFERFLTAMDTDFDTPIAMSEVFELVRAINRSAGGEDSAPGLDVARATLGTMLSILGIDPSRAGNGASGDAAPFIDLLLQVRSELRTQKMWALSDQIRDGLNELGITIADSATGATWRKQ